MVAQNKNWQPLLFSITMNAKVKPRYSRTTYFLVCNAPKGKQSTAVVFTFGKGSDLLQEFWVTWWEGPGLPCAQGRGLRPAATAALQQSTAHPSCRYPGLDCISEILKKRASIRNWVSTLQAKNWFGFWINRFCLYINQPLPELLSIT